MNALKNLGLNVVKANVYLDSSGKHNKFAITKAYVFSYHQGVFELQESFDFESTESVKELTLD